MVSNAVSHSFARQVEAEGVTVAEWVFLRALYEFEPTAPSFLADQMGMTRGAISKLADRLLDKCLIGRVANPDDKRARTLALSAAGRVLVPRLAKLADNYDEEFFDVLTSDERQRLALLLRKIVQKRELRTVPLD
jgi:DNA-binding MarR family transcriptional regulator